MHTAARAWDRERTRIGWAGRGRFMTPTADRPCDFCGQPVGVDGKYIHPECLIMERMGLHEIGRLRDPVLSGQSAG